MARRRYSLILFSSLVVLALLAAQGTDGWSQTGSAGVSGKKVALVSLNQSTVAQLQEVTGIGPTVAQRIVEYRRVHGPFESVEDLAEIKGIGEARLKSIKQEVTL